MFAGGNFARRAVVTLVLTTHHAGETMATEPYHDDPGARHAVTERSAVEARQGVISGRVFLVLVTSLTAAIIALVVGYFAVR